MFTQNLRTWLYLETQSLQMQLVMLGWGHTRLKWALHPKDGALGPSPSCKGTLPSGSPLLSLLNPLGSSLHRVRWLDSIKDSMDMNLSKFWKIVKDREAWHAAGHGVTKSQTQLNNWKTSTNNEIQVPSTNKYLNTELNEHIVWTDQAWSLWSSQCLQSKRENRY